MVWSGSGIEKECFDLIRSLVPDGGTVIEFGAGGVSTENLSKHYKLCSFESSLEYLAGKIYYAPIVDGWYDRSVLEKVMPSHSDLVLIDGPSGTGNRYGVLHNLDLIRTKYIIVHDTDRAAEKTLAECIGLLMKKEVEFMNNLALIKC